MSEKAEINTILYASDLGPQVRPVFLHALSMAKQYQAEIIMLHVIEPLDDMAKAVIDTYLSAELTEDVKKDAMLKTIAKMKKRLENFYTMECDDSVDKDRVTEVKVVVGKPSEEILRIAEEDEADLIVMGKSTRRVRGAVVMGSTARRVSRMADTPVLLVPNYDSPPLAFE